MGGRARQARMLAKHPQLEPRNPSLLARGDDWFKLVTAAAMVQARIDYHCLPHRPFGYRKRATPKPRRKLYARVTPLPASVFWWLYINPHAPPPPPPPASAIPAAGSQNAVPSSRTLARQDTVIARRVAMLEQDRQYRLVELVELWDVTYHTAKATVSVAIQQGRLRQAGRANENGRSHMLYEIGSAPPKTISVSKADLRDEVWRLYTQKKLTMHAIARQIGISSSTVILWLRLERIAREGWQNEDQARLREIDELLAAGLTVEQVAKQVKTAPGYVRMARDRHKAGETS